MACVLLPSSIVEHVYFVTCYLLHVSHFDTEENTFLFSGGIWFLSIPPVEVLDFLQKVINNRSRGVCETR